MSAVDAQGLDLSVLDSASAGDTVDSVDGDPTVALSPDEVEELLQRMVDRQDPEESAALVEEVTEDAEESEESEEAAEDGESKSAESKSASAASAEAPEEAEEESASESAVEKAEEVLQPAQKTSLAWLWIVLLLALVVVGLIMIFGPK